MNSSSGWLGQYTDGQTAVVHEVSIRIDAQGMHLRQQGAVERITSWAISDLVIDDSFSGMVRVSSRNSGDAAVVVSDPSFRVALVGAGALPPMHRRGALLAALAAGVVVAGVGIWFVVDPLSRTIATRVPMSLEYKVKEPFAKQFGTDQCSTAEGAQAVDALKLRLVGPKPKIEYDIRVVPKSTVNAFALPGGVIFLHKALIDKADSADEVAGVLAHEMEHVRRRHIMTGLVRSALLSGVWQVAVGDFTGLLAVDPSTAYQLASLKFDRDAEAEADAGAVALLDRAHISRQGLAGFFKRMRGDGRSMPDIASTHPDHERRIAVVEESRGTRSPRPALTVAQWNALRSICGEADPDEENGDDDDDDDDGGAADKDDTSQ